MTQGRAVKVKPEHIEEEFQDVDGYWIYLKPGLKSDSDPIGNLHIIHEDTKTEAYKVGAVLLCDCAECLKLIEAGAGAN